MNGDGLVNLDDVGPFVLALTNRTAYDAQYQMEDTNTLGDIDMSGTFDLGDLSAMSLLFSSSSASATSPAMPEPSSLMLAFLGVASVTLCIAARR